MISLRLPGSEKRRQQLEGSLAAYKLRIRHDSTLCTDFVNGHSSMSAECIAQRLAHVEYLLKYRRAEYKAAVDDVAREYGYRKAVRMVQLRPEFAAPSVFPWMTAEKKSCFEEQER